MTFRLRAMARGRPPGIPAVGAAAAVLLGVAIALSILFGSLSAKPAAHHRAVHAHRRGPATVRNARAAATPATSSPRACAGVFGSAVRHRHLRVLGPHPLSALQRSCVGGLRVLGPQLFNGAGHVVTLKGVVRSGTEYMCTEGYGIFDGPTGRAEFEPMVAWGIDTVFIGLNEDCWLGINGAGIAHWSQNSGRAYRKAIRAEVRTAERYGLYPVLGFFWGDPGTLVPKGTDPNGGGQPPLPDNDHAPLFWEEVAGAFKNDPNVIFRLQEEPHPENSSTDLTAWQCWSSGDVQYASRSVRTPPAPPVPVARQRHCAEKATDGRTPYETVGMQSLTNIIRGTGATNVIQVPGLAYANMTACTPTVSPLVCGMLDRGDGVAVHDPMAAAQLMVDLDVYPDQQQDCDTTACYEQTFGPVIDQMPLALGEIGPTGSTDTQAGTLLDWLDAHQAGYYAWAWDTWAGLIADYRGTPTPAWGTDYQRRLTGVRPPPPAQPRGGIRLHVQTAPCTNLPTATMTVAAPVRTGDDLFLVSGGGGYTAPAQVLTGVSDNLGGHWIRLSRSPSQLGGGGQSASYAVYERLAGPPAAAGTLRITLTGTSGRYSSGSTTIVQASGVRRVAGAAFDATLQHGDGGSQTPTTFSSPAVLSASGDVLVGLFGSYSHAYQGFTAPPGWHVESGYWATGQDCAASAASWQQVTGPAGPRRAEIRSTSDEYHFGGVIVLRR